MKTLKKISFLIAGLSLLIGCSKFEKDLPFQTFSDNQVPEWTDLIKQIDLGSDIILVQKDGSIQDAINAAWPGSVIYIEPGIYKEALNIDKTNIRLIGLTGEENEAVIIENPGDMTKGINYSGDVQDVEFINLQLRNFNEPGVKILPWGITMSKKGTGCLSMTREDLGQGIAHYQFEVTLGRGDYDKVRLNRVVKEFRPYHPYRTRGDIFMVHAAIQDFDDIYFRVGAENINEKTSSPFYLASKGIDVWGIDLAWTLVPMETTDFTFMKDWGLERDVDHTLAAMSIARLIRGLTRQGFNRMNLQGYCCTVNLIYYAAEKETRIHPVLRDIKGLIPVEGLLKFDPTLDNYKELLGYYQNATDVMMALLEGGTYNYADGPGMIYMASLALNSPDDLSPIPPFSDYGLTNYQAYLLAGCSPFENDIPCLHYFGGSLEEGFLYSDVNRFIRMGVNLNPHMPLKHLYDGYAWNSEYDVVYDDHLKDIRLPILYIGSEGGIGSYGVYSSSLTSSNDITNHIVTKGVDRCIDYGHADIWMAYDADKLIWEPMCKWLLTH